MSETRVLKNFHFCGTKIHAEHKGSASIEVMNEVKNTVILSGVGSPSKKNYPTPGTFDTCIKDDKVDKKHRWYRVTAIYTVLGFIRGTGEEDNIQHALKHIEKEYNQFTKESKVIPVINISGFSRGGASGIRLANEIYKRYGNRIEVNLFLIDPNAGFGRHHSVRKINIPPCVKNVYFTFSTDETCWYLTSKGLDQYQFLGSSTQMSAIALPGKHQEQDLAKPNQETQAMKQNKNLMKQFFDHYNQNPAENAIHANMHKLANKNGLRHIGKNIQAWKDNALLRPLCQLQQELKNLSDTINTIPPDDAKYNVLRKLNYQAYMMLSQMIRACEKNTVKNDCMPIRELALATTKLLQTLKQGKLHYNDVEEQCHAFKKSAQITGVSASIRATAGKILGIVAALPGLLIGPRGAQLAYRCVKRNISGHKVERDFAKAVNEFICLKP